MIRGSYGYISPIVLIERGLTIQRYIALVRPAQPSPPSWATFWKNHAKDMWVCDLLPVIDLGVRPLYLFFIVDLASRRVVHFGVTRAPTDDWVVQQLREATPFGQARRFLIWDRDRKYGEPFTRVAVGTSIEILKTPYHAPKANAICERFLGSVRRGRGRNGHCWPSPARIRTSRVTASGSCLRS